MKKDKQFWLRFFGEEVEIYVVHFSPPDEEMDFVGACRTKKLARELIRKDAKEYNLKVKDYDITKTVMCI